MPPYVHGGAGSIYFWKCEEPITACPPQKLYSLRKKALSSLSWFDRWWRRLSAEVTARLHWNGNWHHEWPPSTASATLLYSAANSLQTCLKQRSQLWAGAISAGSLYELVVWHSALTYIYFNNIKMMPLYEGNKWISLCESLHLSCHSRKRRLLTVQSYLCVVNPQVCYNTIISVYMFEIM